MAQTPPSQQQFCVRWNSHLGSLGAAFPQLLAGQRFVDVTLACEGHQLHCHRLVLAACSAYFESLLSENPCKHPIIIMPHDIKLWEIQALVDFMYKGEVNVSQAGLPDLLKCAEVLQIRGLCGSDAALNLNSIVRTKEYTVPSTVSVQPHLITATVTSASPPCSTTTTSTVSTLASVSANNGNNVNNVQTLPKPSPNEPNSPRETCTSPNIQNSGTASAQNNSIKRSPPVYEPNTSQVIKAAGQPSKFATSTPNNSVAPKVEPVDEMMEEYTDEETIGMSAKGEREESEYLDGSSKQSTEKHLHHPTKTQQHIIENLEEQIDDAYRQENENYKRNMYKNLKSTLMLRPSLLDHDYEEENIFNEDSEDSGSEDNRKNQRQKKSTPTSSTSSMVTRKRLNVSPSEKSSKRLAIASSSASVGSSTLSSSPSRSPDSSVANNNNCCRTTNNNLGKIRVKSNENLYGNYSNIVNTNANALNTMDPTDEEMQLLPPSLKFNKEQMTIFVKKSDIISQGSLAGLQSAKIVAGPMIHAVRSLASTSTSVVSMSGNNVVIRDFVVSNKSADNFIRSGSITCAASVRSVHNVGTETDDHSRITGSGGVQLVSSGSGSSSGSSSIGSPGSSDDNSNRSIGSICDDTPEIGETATIKTETDITEEEQDSNSNYENIVCSPNVNAFHNNDDDDDEEYDEDNSNEQTINAQDGGYDEMPNFDDITLGSNYGGPTANRSLLINQQQMPTSNMPTILIPTLANYNNANTQIAHNSACSSTTGIARIGARPNLLKNTLLLTYNRNSGKIKEVVGQITVSDSAPDLCYQTAEEAGNIGGGVTFSRLDPNAIQHIQQGSLGGSANPPSPSPSAVVLRNPRSNQPRSYSTEALYAALMDVKAGESIYRASQLHKVPRKTLRNWMKRWHIKSAFPMPRQLKQAAEKKRLKQMELKLENYTV